MLGLLVFIAFYLLVLRGASKRFERMAPEAPKVPACPPHQWEELDQPGMENVHYLRCRLCGRFPVIESREGGEF